jgi:hypothetical protein
MSTSQRILFWAAIVFLGSAVFHGGVWLSAGMPPLDGPVSWRKPMTFGVSTGVLFLSLVWVVGLLPQNRRLVRQVSLFTALLIAEVALIDMQQWRGVPSHFNNATVFDAVVFQIMGLLIISASVIIALWTRGLFAHPLPTPSTYAFAARAGMLLLNAGNLVGLAMAVTGAAALKPLHAAALHAIQALPVAVWLFTRLADSRHWHGTSRSTHRLSSPPVHQREAASPGLPGRMP